MSVGSVQIYGVIGTGEGQISHQNVVDQLAVIGQVDTLEIHINSKGGDVWEALGIYSTLNQYKAHKLVCIDGIALSCASWIACVGDEILIAENGMYMYHEGRANPGQVTADELIKTAETVRQLNDQMAETYAARTGIPVSDIVAGMKATTWLRAKDAVKLGFATKMTFNKAIVACGDLAIFNNVPDWVQSELTALIPMEAKAMPEVNASASTVTETTTATELQTATLATSPPSVVVNVGNQSATPVAPAVPEVVDVAVLTANIRKQVQADTNEIYSICNLAGAPEMAAEFMQKGTAVADVQKAMYARVCAERKPVGSEVGNVTNSGEVPSIEAKYRDDFKKFAATMSLGITEDEYVAAAKARDAKK